MFRKTNFSPSLADNLKLKGNSKNFYSYIKTESVTTNRTFYPTSGHEFSTEAGIAKRRRANFEIYNSMGKSADFSGLTNGQPAFYRLAV